SDTTWKICATNLNDSVYWAQVYYDGSNLFTLCPKDYNLWLDDRPKDNQVFATISSSPLYVSPVADTLGVASIYLTYVLSTNNVQPDERGVVELPLPWELARGTPRGF